MSRGDGLDASLLLLPAIGFVKADDPRMLNTMHAIEQHLMQDGLLLRHDPRQHTVLAGQSRQVFR